MHYLSGKDGTVQIGTGEGAISVVVTNFTYSEKDDVHRSRASGARGTSRVHLGTDWSADVEGVVVAGTAPLDISTLRGAHSAFALATDDAPIINIAGAGIVTEREYGSPVEGNVTIKIKIECDSADAADLPTITTAAS